MEVNPRIQAFSNFREMILYDLLFFLERTYLIIKFAKDSIHFYIELEPRVDGLCVQFEKIRSV